MKTWFESLGQDIRYGVRGLRKNPGFAAAAIVLLALGIGANTAIFSLVRAVVLRPLPFPDPDRLVLLWDDLSANGGPTRVEASAVDYVAWKEQSRSFSDVAAFYANYYNLTGVGEPEKLAGVRTTANVFAILGLRAMYFLLADALRRFELLKYALALILIFVGLKMTVLTYWFGGKFPIEWSLGIIAALLIGAVIASVLRGPREHLVQEERG